MTELRDLHFSISANAGITRQHEGVAMQRITEESVYVLRLDKGNEHYVFVYTKAHQRDMLYTLTRWAMDEELAFSWLDACRIATEIRNW
jgi:hypothetical protein